MDIVKKASLAATLDAINDTFFFKRTLSRQEREKAAQWIAARQGLPRSYAGMIAPTDNDFKRGVRLFTGERFTSMAGVSHILGEEGCRALILLKGRSASVRDALARAAAQMITLLGRSRPPRGIYCCGTCSVSLWRHLAAGGLNKQEQRLQAGIKYLQARRNDVGRWQSFPFYYTLLALSEIELAAATRELRFAAPACERALKRLKSIDRYSARRRLLLERVLSRS